MLGYDEDLSIRKQAKLLDVARSSFYYKALINKESCIANLIREVYLDSDCRYGYRKITKALQSQGEVINSKKVLRIMQDMGIQGIYPIRFVNTSLHNNEHKIYPYLLTGLAITKPNQVWATDITYIKLSDCFIYFIAIIDLYSRYIISWDLSHSLEAEFCITTLQQALTTTLPEIFNSDQGAQFTSNDFVAELANSGVQISMDHKGRCFDNIFVERLWRTLKQESIYYYRPETITELEKCIADFVPWYNDKRLHQSLNYKTPAFMYLQ